MGQFGSLVRMKAAPSKRVILLVRLKSCGSESSEDFAKSFQFLRRGIGVRVKGVAGNDAIVAQ